MGSTIDGINKRIKNLSQIIPFGSLSKEQLSKIAASLEEQTYPARAFIGKQGELSKHVLYLILSGKVEVFVTDKNGNETIIGFRGPGEFMGEAVFLSDEEYPASARALEDTHCYLFSTRVISELFEENTDFASYIARLLADRLRILYKKVHDEDEGQVDGGFSKRIQDIMVHKVVTCKPEDNVKQIATTMDINNVSSVVVVDNHRKPLGIITEGDLVTRVLRRDDPETSASLKAKDLMTIGLLSLSPYDFSYQAFLLMVKHRIKHVMVLDNKGTLLGIVSMRDVIKSRKTGSLAIVNNLEAGKTLDDVVKLRPEIDQVLQALLSERATVMEITSLITEFYDRITRKIIEISEKAMIDEGYGPPPVDYCWITMGSSGRKEQFARTDQDNGIIFEDVSNNRIEEVKKYFLILGNKVVTGLEKYGFNLCIGKVMANNEAWCHSFQGWSENIREWITLLDPEKVRLMTIFLDFRYVYGKKSLYDLLRNFVVSNFRNCSVVLSFLVQDNLTKKVPLNIFRQIQTERSGEYRNQLNLKSSACVHIVDCVRAFALREGLLATNTFERLAELGKRNVFGEQDAEQIAAAYETLMLLRIKNSMNKMRKGLEPNNYIYLHELSERAHALLRESLIVVSRLQGITGNSFRITP